MRSPIARLVLLALLAVISLFGCDSNSAAVSSSTPPVQLVPRKVMLVVTDDLGDATLDQAIALGVAPNLAAMIQHGTRLRRHWTAPVCSPSRARIECGLDPYRAGNQCGALTHHDDPYNGPSAVWIGEGMSGTRIRLGKWHESGSANFPANTLRGYDAYAGSHGNLNQPVDATHTSFSYYSWWKSSTTAPLTHKTTFATNDLYADADVALTLGYDFIYLSPNAIHKPILAAPPQNEPPGVTYPASATEAERRMHYLQHLDYRLGLLFDRAYDLGYVVIFTADNGTAGQGKGQMFEDGLRTPLLIRGRGVRAGYSSDRLVQETDIWSVCRRLRGAPYLGIAADSFDFCDEFMLGFPQTAPERNLLTCDVFDVNGAPPDAASWARAVSNDRWKLIKDAGGIEHLFDLAADPAEDDDLLLHLSLTTEQQAALDYLRANLQHIP